MESKGIRLEQRHEDAIAEAQEVGIANNGQEAARTLIDRGARSYGLNGHGEGDTRLRRAVRRSGDARSYGLNGHGEGDTRLRRAVRRSGDALAVVAILMLGGTLFAPDAVRVPFVLLPLVSALAMYGLDRVLGRHEPRVSAWLKWGEGA